VDEDRRPLRVLQSFPHKIGAGRICDTAWHQAEGVAAAGAQLTVFPGVVHRPLPGGVKVEPTLSRGRWRIPYRAVGLTRALALHDRIVARRLERRASEFDLVHAWPLGALETLRTAMKLGIPTVLERPNTHTRFAFAVVRDECERLGIELPSDYEHAYNPRLLALEEQEYRLATQLLCPSDFVRQTFLDEGFAPAKLARHFYGYDETTFQPGERGPVRDRFTMLFAGLCAVRKGVHFALEAWVSSPASRDGRFLIAGEFLPAYQEKLAPLLGHPTVEVLGHRTDVAELMRVSDVLVLPSIEEGSALAVNEAIASGCVPLVSDRASGVCVHDVNSLVHAATDTRQLAQQITAVYESGDLLARLRDGCRATAPLITWRRAGQRLLEVYHSVAEEAGQPAARPSVALTA
jgi:glycosyltransferase involved in cell wall biosynthesis